jgi:hypothetical protein
MVKKLSDMVVSQSQASQDAVAALEKRLLARIDAMVRDVSGGFWTLVRWAIILFVALAAIDFIRDLL